MKNTNLRKLIALLMSAMVLLSLLAGCGNNGNADASENTNGTENTTIPNTKASGMLVVNANGAVNVFYDKDGLVLELETIDDDGAALIAGYENYLGEPCASVIATLIEDSVMMGNLDRTHFVMIKQAVGSALPGTNFLQDITADAQAMLDTLNSTAKLLVLGEGDLDQSGYIDLISAKDMALAYLDITDFDSFDGESTPTNGTYYFTVTCNGIEEYVSVNAVTGLVSNAFLDMPEEDTEFIGNLPEAETESTSATTSEESTDNEEVIGEEASNEKD